MTQTQTSGVGLATGSLTPLHWAGIGLAAVTGVLHLWLGVSFAPEPMGISFLLAGLGFFGGAALVAIDYRRRLLYAIGVPFTAVQIPLWYVVNAPDFSSIGLLDKAVQLALVAVLVVLFRREG